jgi:hypothetical protein
MNFYEGKRKEAHFMLDKVIDTIIAKNTDYGDSFSITGRVGASTRLMDKAMRLHTLSCKNNEPQVKDEAIEDTAMDLFAYALMYQLKFNNKVIPAAQQSIERECCNAKIFPIDMDSYIVVENQVHHSDKTFNAKEIIQSGKDFGNSLGYHVCYNFLFGFIQAKIETEVVANWRADILDMLDQIPDRRK